MPGYGKLGLIYEVARTEVKSTQVFQLNKFYEQFRYFCTQEGYAPASDPDFPEIYFWESRTQTKGREFLILWRPTKEIAGNKFFRRYIEIDLHGVGITEVEIMYNGKKVKANKGKMEVLVRAKVEIDVGRKWLSSPFWSQFLEIFYKRIWRKELEMAKKETLVDMYKFTDFAKKFFGLKTLGPQQDSFVPKKGFEDNNF